MNKQNDTKTIRPADLDEAPLLSGLAMRSKGYWGYDDAFLSACEKELTVSEAELANNPGYVIEDSERVIGFYILEPFSKSKVELSFLFVEPDEIGCGNGGRLMRHATSTASTLGFKTMLIQGDPHAEAFYRVMGAVKIGARLSVSIPGRELPLYRIDLAAP